MNAQRAAEIQAVLEGIPLPASRQQVISYGAASDPTVVADLEGLPDEEFRRLDEVGRLLTLVPTLPRQAGRFPRPESGKPPGGRDYLEAHPRDTGLVRHDAPRENPPQKAIEHASQRQQKQKAEQGG